MTTRRKTLAEIEKFELLIARSFGISIDNIRNSVSFTALISAIDSGDFERIERALSLREARFSELVEANRSTFLGGGQFSASQAPASLGFSFDVTSQRAAQFLLAKNSRLLDLIINDQRQMIRDVIAEGVNNGINPRSIALDLVGRVDRRTGRRTGGRLGLTQNQAKYVSTARSQLLSGDTGQMRAYLSRQARDKRFDSMVIKAIANESPVAVEDAIRISNRYADRLLKVRGDTIARTEALESFHAGQDEALLQAIEEGFARPEDVVKVWSSSGDERVRNGHRLMNGATVGINELFTDPVTGDRLRYPADSNASAATTINCRCTMLQRVNWANVNVV